MECSIINPAVSLLMKHLVIGQCQKAPTGNFSAFHWSPHSSLVSIGQHFVTTRVVHLPTRTETSVITESDQSGPNHQLFSYARPTQHTAWFDSDQAVRAVHSCNSWFCTLLWAYFVHRCLYVHGYSTLFCHPSFKTGTILVTSCMLH